MTSLETSPTSDDLHPIDLVEYLASALDWDFDRIADDQIAMAQEGAWQLYNISWAWSEREETLRFVCTFDLDPAEARLPELYKALDGANDRVWNGSFTYWAEHKMIVFRYGLNLSGGAVASTAQIAGIQASALEVCERFYPAFQLVCGGGQSADQALGIAMSQAYGRA